MISHMLNGIIDNQKLKTISIMNQMLTQILKNQALIMKELSHTTNHPSLEEDMKVAIVKSNSFVICLKCKSAQSEMVEEIINGVCWRCSVLTAQ